MKHSHADLLTHFQHAVEAMEEAQREIKAKQYAEAEDSCGFAAGLLIECRDMCDHLAPAKKKREASRVGNAAVDAYLAEKERE